MPILMLRSYWQRLRQFWSGLRDKFAVVFIIGLALSTASILENVGFIIDVWHSIVALASRIAGLEAILNGLATLLAQAVAWWRVLTAPLFDALSQLIGWRIPSVVQDFISVAFFAFARGLNAAGRWENWIQSSKLAPQLEQLKARYSDDQIRHELELKEFLARERIFGALAFGAASAAHVGLVLGLIYAADFLYARYGVVACLLVLFVVLYLEWLYLNAVVYRIWGGAWAYLNFRRGIRKMVREMEKEYQEGKLSGPPWWRA